MSRKLIYHKISNIQRNLMGKNIEDYSLDTLIPLIFKECAEQNLMFFSNFVENACVLNIRDTVEENLELNVRYYHEYSSITPEVNEMLESRLLCNTFLLTSNVVDIGIPIKDESSEKVIPQYNGVPPRAVRAAMDVITARGETPTKKLIENELHFDKMSKDNRNRCIAYLRDMEA